MIGFAKHIARGLYFSLSRLLFVLKSQTPAPGLKIYYGAISSVLLQGHNKIGNNCKIIIPQPANSRFTMSHGSWIRDRVEINLPTSTNILLGPDVSIQDNCKLIGDIHIGAGSIIAPDVFMASGSHYPFTYPTLAIREQDKLCLKDGFKSAPIHIGEDCWIGKGAVIAPGITIGRGSVIGSHARISKDVAPYTVVVGNNQAIKKRLNFNPPTQVSANEASIPYFYEGCYSSNFRESPVVKFRKQATIILANRSDFSSIVLDLEGNQNVQIDLLINSGLRFYNYNPAVKKSIPFADFEEVVAELPEKYKDLQSHTVIQLSTVSTEDITIQQIALA